MIRTELFFIVDSDDFLKKDAIEIIYKYWNTIENKENFSGICFRKIDIRTNKILGKKLPTKIIDTDIFTIFKKYKIYADKAEIFKSEVFKDKRFPERDDEKFFSELYLWVEATKNNKRIRFIDEGIYYCEYLNEGLTKSIKQTTIKSPNNSKLYYKKIIKEKRFGLIMRLRAIYRYLELKINLIMKGD